MTGKSTVTGRSTTLLLAILVLLMSVVVGLNLFFILYPATRFQLWLNRPGRALIASWRFKVPYGYAYIIFLMADLQGRGTVDEEQQRRQAIYLRLRYPKQVQRSLQSFDELFLRNGRDHQ